MKRSLSLSSILLTLQLLMMSNANVKAAYWTQQLAGLPDFYDITGIIGFGSNILAGGTPYYSSTVIPQFNASTDGHRVYRFLRVNGNLLGVGDSAILKSTDDGQTWTPTSMGFPTISIGPDARLSNDGNTIYTWDPNNNNFGYLVYKSTDGGNTWVPTNIQKPDGYGFLVHNGVIYESSLTTLQYSPDNGSNWYYVTTIGSSINEIVAFHDTIFVATNTGVHKSSDGGQHWARTIDKNTLCLCVAGTSLLCGTYESGVWQSDITGNYWISRSEDLPGIGIATGVYKQITSLSLNDNYAMASVRYDTVNVGPVTFHSLFTLPVAGLGTEDIKTAKPDVNVYPNPAREELFVEAGQSFGQNIRLSLIDLKGQVVQSGEYTNGTIKLNIANVPAGIYMLQISDSKNSLSRKIEITK